MQWAIKYGRVIALVNSDEAILKTKGWLGEPFEKRKASLENSGMVDRVIKIETDPTEALKAIRPDYQVLGNDYTEEMVKGSEYIGEIIITPRLDLINICSSKIREKKLRNSNESYLRSDHSTSRNDLQQKISDTKPKD